MLVGVILCTILVHVLATKDEEGRLLVSLSALCQSCELEAEGEGGKKQKGKWSGEKEGEEK